MGRRFKIPEDLKLVNMHQIFHTTRTVLWSIWLGASP